MTPLARKLTDLGQAVGLYDQDLIEAIRWFAVRGIGFTVRTTYDMKGDGGPAGYDIKRDFGELAEKGGRPVAEQQAGVTLGYSKSKGQYHVDEIRGNSPTVEFQHREGRYREFEGKDAKAARAGMWLSEAEATALGLVADLTIKPRPSGR